MSARPATGTAAGAVDAPGSVEGTAAANPKRRVSLTLRGRMTIVASAAVAVAIVMASAVAFFLVRADLRNRVDASLEEIASQAHVTVFPDGDVRVFLSPAAFGGATGYAQLINVNGPVAPPGQRTLPASPEALEVASGHRDSYFEDVRTFGVHLRVYTTTETSPPLPQGVALQVARPLTEVDQALRELAFILGLVCVVGVALAAGMGYAVTRAAVRPITALTEAAEHVTETGDLSRRIDATGDDEVGRLAASFNQMLEALQTSREAQQRLVADASHELRTPLTSLQTNIEVLTGGKQLPEADRERLLSDVRTQIAELTALVGDLTEAGRGVEAATVQDVRLDELVRAAATRAGARAAARGVRFDIDLEPTLVVGAPDRLERAIVNLLDDAVKFSPDGADVQVRLRGGELAVRDHGAGIAPEDLPHIFERFYRSAAARGTPGSGLGLSIVEQVARAHGGTVTAENAPGGGALFRLRLPAIPPATG